jgi:hypothetical protein
MVVLSYFWYNTFSMKSVTISLSEQELEEWKEEAWRARKRLSEWVRGRVREGKQARERGNRKTVEQEEMKPPKQEDKKPGVQVEINEGTANTAAEAKARVEELARLKKQKEEVRRLEGAREALEKRFK